MFWNNALHYEDRVVVWASHHQVGNALTSIVGRVQQWISTLSLNHIVFWCHRIVAVINVVVTGLLPPHFTFLFTLLFCMTMFEGFFPHRASTTVGFSPSLISSV